MPVRSGAPGLVLHSRVWTLIHSAAIGVALQTKPESAQRVCGLFKPDQRSRSTRVRSKQVIQTIGIEHLIQPSVQLFF